MPLTPIKIKNYLALMSQLETNAPTANIIINTYGSPITWSRAATGIYRGTLTNAFPLDKTIITGFDTKGKIMMPIQNSNWNDYCYTIAREDNSNIVILFYNTNDFTEKEWSEIPNFGELQIQIQTKL